MNTLLTFLLLCSMAVAESATQLKPALVRDVSLQKVPLNERERIESFEVTVTGARIVSVHIPRDWGFEVQAPAPGIAVLKARAGHGVGMLLTVAELQRFITIAFDDHGHLQHEFSIKVKLVVYLYGGKEEQDLGRVLHQPPKSVVLEEVKQPPRTSEPKNGPNHAVQRTSATPPSLT